MARYYDANNSFRKPRGREEVDPMSSMGNIGDVMLVFACGLMVALVVAWNVDLKQFTEVEKDKELAQEDVNTLTDENYGEGDGFVEMGKVYQDPATGKYYLVEENDAGGSSSPSSGDGGSNGE